MKIKTSRMEALKMLISSQELGSQEEVLQALAKEGYTVTQATLSRDLKQLKVAKAASMNGRYVYVLPNETMYKRVPNPRSAREMLMTSGYLYQLLRQHDCYQNTTRLCKQYSLQYRQQRHSADLRNYSWRRHHFSC